LIMYMFQNFIPVAIKNIVCFALNLINIRVDAILFRVPVFFSVDLLGAVKKG